MGTTTRRLSRFAERTRGPGHVAGASFGPGGPSWTRFERLVVQPMGSERDHPATRCPLMPRLPHGMILADKQEKPIDMTDAKVARPQHASSDPRTAD